MIKKGSLIEVENMDFYNDKKIVKVFLRGINLEDCEQGEQTEIITSTGHVVRGIVSERKCFYNNPRALGKNVKEILFIRHF
ncbi:hypothetical protein [Clostridium luticellarii]|jgi:hypothetical protein|uniref:Uncharacterized protein n=1 Tax=Clostridium luticellarii TaxID=1691940 RepID=A0A2T0BRJ7_9CLOT|nr:hypothetical protein [Clostridium luticellarii]MCI1943790.1 hypothetical protein [Clostridium luticellarii]MCI1967051.1 hypothetical protein [Clostridium luticellarii]MCI1994418.1 hypothetical protein [Clostridium luticellarii]MCI2038629.1 hypothetical protein [Clostridium luticellarii]PRR86503.1 hypothetical protein CLLU_06010 [Clostridium luticellarii]